MMAVMRRVVWARERVILRERLMRCASMHDRRAAVIFCPLQNSRRRPEILKLAWIDRGSGTMPDVENDHLVTGRGVKDPIGEVAERDDPDGGPFFKHAATRREQRKLFDGGGRVWVALSEVISTFRQVG